MSAHWQHLIEIAGAFVVVAVIVLLVNSKVGWRAYDCALQATIIFLPNAMAFASVALFLLADRGSFRWWLNSDGARAYATGSYVALLLWLLLAPAARAVAQARTANAAEYDRLVAIRDGLRTRYRYASSQAQGVPGRLSALAEGRGHLVAASELLDRKAPSPRWTTGSGYVDVVRRLHRADEALIEFDFVANVQAGASADDSRIDGSRIGGSRQLLARIAASVKRLEQDPWDARARVDLAHVREAVDDYRDSRRASLVRQRASMTASAILMAVGGYALLGIAMFVGASRSQIVAATVFYLVGATIGLFSELQAAMGRAAATEDYGVSRARLYLTPIFSGVAAIGGVVATAMLLAVTPGPVNTGVGTTAATTMEGPATGAAQSASTQPEPPPRLGQIFDLSRYPLNVLIAAVFGLTPTLLTTRLRAAAERYKTDLRSTEAAEQTPAA
jgi:hypothetical protein